MTKSPFVVALCLLASSLFAANPAFAEDWPRGRIRMIVTFSAGGGTDIVARVIAPKLSDALGQTVFVDNRPGANGMVGTEAAAKALPDGDTLLMAAAGPMTIAPNVFRKHGVPFDTIKDFRPIALVAIVPLVIVVNPSLPVSSLKELVAYAKDHPGELNFGSSGIGGSPHLAGELFDRMAGVKMQHVPYKGLAPAITDLLSGQLQVLFADVGLVAPHVREGKLRALAVTSDQRSSMLPDVPTAAEAGVADYRAATWYGLVAPVAIPDAIRDRLSAEMHRILAMPDVRATLAAQGNEVVDMSMEAFGKLVRDDFAKWQTLAQEIHLELE